MSVTKPIFRMFDYDKTIGFYVNWLGFTVDWRHSPDDNFPVYMQVSRGDIVLHLSQHHGDGSPGARIFIEDFDSIVAYHQLLLDKNYKYNRPGLEKAFWDPEIWTVQVIDPASNIIIFNGK